ncbi:MAG TPA: patatin-like phospholipase family protein [Trueperaceae bacterium]
MDQDPASKPSIGVALGGGSARGYAHIGALRCLERNGLAPDVVVGTSFGALIGALYAAGLGIPELTRRATDVRRRDLLRQVPDFGLHKAALFRGDRLENYFDELVEGRNFADLACRFVVVATDVDSGERVLLNDGSLARALRASASMPGIFAPVEYQGRRLVDGGLGSPVPLDTLEEQDVDIAIGIGVGLESQDSAAIRLALRCLDTPWGARMYARMRDHEGSHPLRVLGRALAYSASAWRPEEISAGEALHVKARPPIGWLNFHKADQAIEAGEAALEAFLPTLREALQNSGGPASALAGD